MYMLVGRSITYHDDVMMIYSDGNFASNAAEVMFPLWDFSTFHHHPESSDKSSDADDSNSNDEIDSTHEDYLDSFELDNYDEVSQLEMQSDSAATTVRSASEESSVTSIAVHDDKLNFAHRKEACEFVLSRSNSELTILAPNFEWKWTYQVSTYALQVNM